MKFNFNLSSFTHKLYLSLFILVAFYILYLTVPNYEFENVSTSSSKIDRVYYAVSTHLGMKSADTMKPITFRSKLLTIVHMLLAYSILLL